MYVVKIVSGGQTGVDRGALAAALKAQFPYGGMIPKGRLVGAAEKYVGRLIAAQRQAEEDLQKMDLVDLKVWFREPYAIQMAEQGIDVVEQVPTWLPKINDMTTERLSANELLVRSVPRAQVIKVKQSIKDGVVDKLGWTEEPSHVVVISLV